MATEQDVAKVKVDRRTSVYSAYNVIAGPIVPIFASGYRTNSHFEERNVILARAGDVLDFCAI